MAVFMIAGRAVAQYAGQLGGRVLFTSVAGETGQPRSTSTEGYATKARDGSSYLVQHGVVGDYALIAETYGPPRAGTTAVPPTTR